MTEQRRLIIHFVDGSLAARLKEALEARHLVIEADGALVVIPFENIRYLQAYPAPKKLPGYAIKGATFKD